MNTLLDNCFAPARLNGLTLKNRFIKAGTFEGMTRGGQPSARLRDFHTRIAAGGVAMTTSVTARWKPMVASTKT